MGRVTSLEQTLHFCGGGSSSLMAINAASAGITQHRHAYCLLMGVSVFSVSIFTCQSDPDTTYLRHRVQDQRHACTASFQLAGRHAGRDQAQLPHLRALGSGGPARRPAAVRVQWRLGPRAQLGVTQRCPRWTRALGIGLSCELLSVMHLWLVAVAVAVHGAWCMAICCKKQPMGARGQPGGEKTKVSFSEPEIPPKKVPTHLAPWSVGVGVFLLLFFSQPPAPGPRAAPRERTDES
jgi:hypothetical protein